mmetsp:Transcript_1732/g.2678  ORF Transcript_1732/g.2678 Transcript_1732/m.2678 type:complete len:297 (+) Transcript_1732:104-994(+)
MATDSPIAQALTHEEIDASGESVTKQQEVEKKTLLENKITPPSRQDSVTEDGVDDEANGDNIEEDQVTEGLEPMEIEQTGSGDGEEEADDDLEALLGSSDSNVASSSATSKQKQKKSRCCCKSKRVGNIIILCERWHERTGYGIIGPHWFGPFVVLFLVALASKHFVHKAATSVGPISTAICVIFLVLTVYYLFDTSFKDPGVVMRRSSSTTNIEDDNDLSDDHRWCDFCNVYQPPDGAHCPDCNVCIAGYDHHCVWMGVCIGKGNMKSFVRFNMCWILYLLYATLWVSLVGPLVF